MSNAEQFLAAIGPLAEQSVPRLKGPAVTLRSATGHLGAGRTAHQQDRLQGDRWWGDHFLLKTAMGFAVPLALLLAWRFGAQYGWVPEQILPAPAVVLQTVADGWRDGSLISDTLISLLRVLRGFAAGAAAGLLLGAGMALSAWLRAYIDPIFLAVSQVPILGWVPLLILLVGIDEALKTIIIALAAFIPITLGTYQGIRDVPTTFREVGRVLTFDRRDTFRIIILPAAIPAIFTGLREGLANGWQTLMAVELLASTEGLGYQMAYGRQLFQLELVLAAMIVIGLIGFSFDWLLGRIARYLQRWETTA